MAYIGKQPTPVPLSASDLNDDIISLAKMAGGTDGNLITYDASGNPAAVATGDDGQILTSAGAGQPPAFEAAAGGGLCLQVVGMSKTDTETYSTASWADIPDMSLAITPTKASSKILLFVTCSFSTYDLGAAGKIVVDIDGGGYNDLLVGDAASNRTQATWGLRSPDNVNDSYLQSKSFNYLHTPSYTLTDVITYKIQWNSTGSAALYLNRQYEDSDYATRARSVSMMTAMEID